MIRYYAVKLQGLDEQINLYALIKRDSKGKFDVIKGNKLEALASYYHNESIGQILSDLLQYDFHTSIIYDRPYDIITIKSHKNTTHFRVLTLNEQERQQFEKSLL